MRKTETVMTYDQWEYRFKKALKKTIKVAAIKAARPNAVAFFILMVGFPLVMIAHWLLFGY